MRRSLAACLFMATAAICGNNELVTVSNLERCDRIPSEFQDSCLHTIRRGQSFKFYVVSETPNSMTIRPVTSFDDGKTRSEVLASKPVAEVRTPEVDRKADALEGIEFAVKAIALMEALTLAVVLILIVK